MVAECRAGSASYLSGTDDVDGGDAGSDSVGEGSSARALCAVGVVERLLFVPRLEIELAGGAAGEIGVDAHSAAMQLASVHVMVGDLDFQSGDVGVASVGDE